MSKQAEATDRARGANGALQPSVDAAIAHFHAGRFQEAALVCQQILSTDPKQVDALNILGLAYHQTGQNEQALMWIERALALVQSDSLYSNQGIVLLAMGRLKEAKLSLTKALSLNSRSASTHANLGTTLQAMGDVDAAILSFRNALRIDSKFALAYSGIGIAFLSKGDLEEAFKHLQEALALNPALVEAHANMGTVLWNQRRLENALESYRNALRLNPHHIPSLENLGLTLSMLNRTEESLASYKKAYELVPTIEHRLQSLLVVPHIHQSRAAMLENRVEFERRLDDLLASDQTTAVVNEQLYCRSAFNLAFQGIDNKAILTKLATFYEKVCPQLLYRAAHIDVPRNPERKIRLGFLSKHIHNHPVAHCFSGLIEALAEQNGFDVLLISAQDFDAESVRNVYTDFKGTPVRIPGDYLRARQAIAELELDILVYQDIGMDEFSYFLAFGRLARFQCVMGGHPDTTGIRNLDYYISSALGEPQNAEEQYSEKLVRLPTGTIFYQKPDLPGVMKGRVDFGLPVTGSLYVCPMMLQKIHPDFDEAVDKLLQADPDGFVIFFKHLNAGWEEDLKRRFDRTIAAPQRERVLFLPWIKDYADFVNLNALADVILDPFHFGIGTTAIATFAVGTPIVTLPGEFMRGRVGLFYSRLLDVPEFIANDLDDYVAKAVQFATDRKWRESVSDRIKENNHRFYEDRRVIEDLTRFFAGLTSDRETMR